MDELIVSYDSDNNEIISYKNATYACEENINDIVQHLTTLARQVHSFGVVPGELVGAGMQGPE